MKRNEFYCRGCGSLHPDCPILHDELWAEVSAKVPRFVMHPRDLLCTSCAEQALDREIQPEDLKDCVGNMFIQLLVTRWQGQIDEVAMSLGKALMDNEALGAAYARAQAAADRFAAELRQLKRGAPRQR